MQETINANNHEQDAVVENAVDDSRKIQPRTLHRTVCVW